MVIFSIFSLLIVSVLSDSTKHMMTENSNLLLSEMNGQTLECNACHRTYNIRKRELSSVILCLFLVFCGAIMYGTKCQEEKRENAMYHDSFCNTTRFHIEPPATGIMTFHSSDLECQWTDIQYFDCQDNDATSQKMCIVKNTNQFNNMEWPCVVRMIDDQRIPNDQRITNNQKIDCQTLPRLEKPDNDKILTCALGSTFMIVGGSFGFCFSLILWLSTEVIRHE